MEINCESLPCPCLRPGAGGNPSPTPTPPYVFSHKWMRSYEYTGEPYKVEIEQARLESGASWARVDGGPKLWVMPFGPVKRSLDELGKVAFESRAKRLRADVQPRDRGFGSTPM